MTGPRREDLRNMDRYPGEHYPVEIDVEISDYDEATGIVGEFRGVERQIRCGCTDSLEHDWPHR